MKTVAFYYDYSSPNAYFASRQLPAIAERHGAVVELRPLLLGALFKALGTSMTPGMSNPLKAAHSTRDFARWGEKYGIAYCFPSRFPMNTVKALRIDLCLEARSAERRAFHADVFEAYWAKDRDISDDAVLRELLDRRKLDADALLAKTGDEEVKAMLKRATEAAQENGVFGAPTFIVDGELYYGKDRLDFVEDALAR